jgi:aspartate aminotransferase
MRARGIRGSDKLCERLLEETGVAILPGRSFGRPPQELTVRLAYVNFNGARALDAAAAVPDGVALGEEFLRENCGETLESVERLCDWVNG